MSIHDSIYDTVPASSLDEGEENLQIIVNVPGRLPDPLENVDVLDLDDAIRVTGLSHLTGDTATYMLNPDTLVDLWAL